MEYVIYINDTETTGTDPKIHDVIELSLYRFSFCPNQIKEEQKTWFLKAQNFGNIQDEALKVNGHKRADITWMTNEGKLKYQEPKLVVPEVEMWMMEDQVSSVDRIFCGHNPDFDIDFTQELWNRVGSKDTYPFSVENGNRVLDTKQLLLFIDICTGKRRQYYNLSSMVEALEVKKGKAHQASEDVRMTKDSLIKMVEPIRETVKEKFKDSYK
jgi:DNA polymerase III alpha subunit (gram-positive type)